MRKRLFDPGRDGNLRDFGLLVLRVATGLALAFGHGYGKLGNLLAGRTDFPDPLGVGNELSLVLAVFGEFVCALALAVGLAGRFSAAVLTIFFCVAFFLIHGEDPFLQKEKAFIYLITSVTLLATGPGRFSLDRFLAKRR